MVICFAATQRTHAECVYLTFGCFRYQVIISNHSYHIEQPLRYDYCSASYQLHCAMDNIKVIPK